MKLNCCKFRTQRPFYIYFLDFYSHKKNLATDVNGDIRINQYDQDEFRDKNLESSGIKTVRVTNNYRFYSPPPGGWGAY